jgi:hypothetical protein
LRNHPILYHDIGQESKEGSDTDRYQVPPGPSPFGAKSFFRTFGTLGLWDIMVRIPNHTNVIKWQCTDYYSKGQGYGTEGTHPLQGVEPGSKATSVRAAESFEPSCHTKYVEHSIFMLHSTETKTLESLHQTNVDEICPRWQSRFEITNHFAIQVCTHGIYTVLSQVFLGLSLD